MGTGKICTKTLLHEGSSMHKKTLFHEIKKKKLKTKQKDKLIKKQK